MRNSNPSSTPTSLSLENVTWGFPETSASSKFVGRLVFRKTTVRRHFAWHFDKNLMVDCSIRLRGNPEYSANRRTGKPASRQTRKLRDRWKPASPIAHANAIDPMPIARARRLFGSAGRGSAATLRDCIQNLTCFTPRPYGDCPQIIRYNLHITR